MSCERIYCGTSLRRQRVTESDADMGDGLQLNGIDFVEVIDREAPDDFRQRLIDVTFLKVDGVAALTKENFSILGGTRITGIRVISVDPTAEARTLRLTLNWAGDFSDYDLHIHAPENLDEPVANMDRRLSCITFGFKVECPSDFDCKQPEPPAPPRPAGPPIDYLTREWSGFRQLMLDRMSTTMPGWSERNPADLGVTLVELLADAADKVSWMQDAIGTEAFFEKTRFRQSLVRHARLLGYRPNEGRNARCAVAVSALEGVVAPVPAIARGTRFLTAPTQPGPPQPVVLPRDPGLFEDLLARGAMIFEAMEDLPTLNHALNGVALHDWGDEGCCLPIGATQAHLRKAPGDLGLSKGDLLILEERIPFGGSQDDPPDPTHRQLVRLSADPVELKDPVFDLVLTEITWYGADALHFALPLGEVDGLPRAVARGNILLADEGRTVDYALKGGAAGEDEYASGGEDKNGLLPDDGPGAAKRYRLDAASVVRAAPFHPENARMAGASTALLDPAPAVAAVALAGEGESWETVPDLLASDRFAAHVAVEPGTADGAAYVRFGDGVLGRAPSTEDFTARIRHGGGPRGNIGAEAIAHVVTADGDAIKAVSNPLPAVGGTAMESRQSVQIAAPQAFRTLKRAVTVEDYEEVAARHPWVARAYGRRTWTGSWYTITLAVDLVGGGKVDQSFEDDLRGFIESHRLAGHDLNIVSPVFVPLDLIFFVCAQPDHYAADVTADLLQLFSDRPLANGQLGLFHPDLLSFGGDVALSPLIARAMRVPGVGWISLRNEAGEIVGRFARMDQPGVDYGDAAAIPIAAGEIARLDNDPSRPAMGRIRFITEGGR